MRGPAFLRDISSKDLGLENPNPPTHSHPIRARMNLVKAGVFIGLVFLAACEGQQIPASQITRFPRGAETSVSAAALAPTATAELQTVDTRISTRTPQLSVQEQQREAVEEALPGILAVLEAETQRVPSPIAEKDRPLSDAEKRNLVFSFSLVNEAVQEDLVAPQALQINPNLSYTYLLTDTYRLVQYWRGNWFNDTTEDQHRNLSFLPAGPIGGTAIAVGIDPKDGRIDDISMGTVLSPQGKAISQFMKEKIPEGDLVKIAAAFWRIPDGIVWQPGPYDSLKSKQLEGNVVWQGRVYRVSISQDGYSSMRIIGKSSRN